MPNLTISITRKGLLSCVAKETRTYIPIKRIVYIRIYTYFMYVQLNQSDEYIVIEKKPRCNIYKRLLQLRNIVFVQAAKDASSTVIVAKQYIKHHTPDYITLLYNNMQLERIQDTAGKRDFARKMVGI